ncbi:hypothetical protein GCM10010918_39320 [Paenibacillus radicis (ex Gao et al. 2016)]|uniref:Uncharacterized protein n=1 Tax=Paenibacillus radicis (ex Gao et al. 2016) TaxID=1737354 RepID=A0A917HGR1_9BACL|nr:hypothetical protein GCM10010918_39320 [Paenibacillus radicis (ex Gao et al. 2016)]
MPLWIEWLTHHWLSVMLIAGAIIAVLYVMINRDMLFYKE